MIHSGARPWAGITLSNGTIQQLAGQRAELMAKLQDNRARYNDRHPLVQQGAASVAELDRQIGTVAGRVRNSLQDQYLVAARQENSLASGVGELRGQRLDEQDRLIRYNILKREVDTNRELYDGLLQRFKQVSAEAGATNNNISIVDRAYASRIPISPNPTNILGLAGIAGLMLALLLVFLREQLTDRIGDPAEVERAIGARLLSVVPKLKGEGRMENAILEAGSPFTEVFHSLRTAIELGENPVPRSILVTSSKSKEGKSSVSLGLARSFAEAGQRVLLIDGDLRLPSLAAYMGMENGPGLAEVLVDGLLLRQAVRRSENFGLDLLTAGKRTDDPAVLLDPDKLRAIVTEAGGLYDMIIIDGPPALGIADATRLGNVAEGAIFVVKSEGVTKEEARLAIKRLREARINVIGAVLSMFEPERGNTAYRYAYGDDQKAAA